MGLTFNVKLSEKTRPPEAKGAGVTKAISALERATRKQVDNVDKAEVDAAYKAAFELLGAFDTALGKIGSANDAKSAEARKPIANWRKVCSMYIGSLKDQRFALQAKAFMDGYNAIYLENRKELMAAHTAAKAARAAHGRAPDNSSVEEWFEIAHNIALLCSKDGILRLEVPGVPKGTIRASDLRLPPDLDNTKKAGKELATWCTEFTKAAQSAQRGGVRGLDTTNSDADRELKAILDEYAKIERAMRPVVSQAKGLATSAKETADKLKAAVTSGNADDKATKDVATKLRSIKDQLGVLNSDVERLNGPWHAAALWQVVKRR